MANIKIIRSKKSVEETETQELYPQEEVTENLSEWANSTYMVVSKLAYLIGVPQRIFENDHEPPKMEWYKKLDVDKNARIVRHLCILRTAIERSFGKIFQAMMYDMKNLHSMEEWIPQDSLRQLMEDGITVEKANCKPNQYIIDINKLICDRINNVKSLFPIWLKWDYIRELFIMPGGLSEAGIKNAAADYYANKAKYPYQVYMNWAYMDSGNILYNDKKFVRLLYEAHEDYFTDLSKVSDAGEKTKAGIYNFLEESDRVALVVDCENSDPYKLYATLNNLDQEALLDKIAKIILYDDVHTTSAWGILERFTEIPIEHNVIERVKENKSLVDIRLTTGTCREYYQNNIDSFILVSSDSDYWGLISAMPEVRFFVMVEYAKCGPDIKNALINSGITYCYIDDFCTGNSNEIKTVAVLSEVRAALDQAFHININTLLEEAYTATRADMSTAEKEQFYNRYIKPMHIVIAANGEASIELGER